MPKTTKSGNEYEDSPRDPQQGWVLVFETAMHYPDKGDASLQKIVRLGRADPRDDRGYFLEIEENDHETHQWGLTRIWNTTIEDDDDGRQAAVFWLGSTITRMFGFAPLSEMSHAVEVVLPESVGRQVLRAIQKATNDEETPNGKLAC